ncbi:MAG: CPBP family intramembrane metalloprotease [Lachnospiraceae bacterium]|nr:CPBP family intramembrane metalloprotease [Lachnospiraceae bacterium]
MKDLKELSPKQVYSRFGGSYLAGYLTYAILATAIIFIMKKAGASDYALAGFKYIVEFIILYTIGFPMMFYLVKGIPARTIPKKKLGVGRFIACICITYTIMSVCNVIGMILNSHIGKITGKGGMNPIVDVLGSMSVIVQVIVAVICAPIFEELAFRKFLLDRISGFGEATAVFISGLMFGLLHGNLAQFTYAFGMGLFLAYIYIRTGKIIYTIMIHMIVNGLSTYLTKFMLKGIDVGEMQGYLINGDMDGYMQFVQQNLSQLAIVGLFGMFVIILCIAGLIIILVNIKNIRFEHHEGEIEKGKKLSTALLNVGMIVFIVYWVTNIVLVQYGINIFG